ncbi:MAG: chorismate mutase [Clostridia bacterium]|nr:chorismate mutase [Clostridia bacterium]
MDINDLRTQINSIDEQIVELFNRRMEVSAGIADYKKANGKPIYDPAREREVLARVSDLAGSETETYARVLFSTLFDLSRSYQASRNVQKSELVDRIHQAMDSTSPVFPQRAVVACQGVEGAYSQIACDKLFSAPSIMYCKSFDGVFQAVQSGLCQFGILPIENSSYGSVGAVYDLMHGHQFHIVRSIRLHIDHCLMVKPGTKLSDVKEIFSHEQALGQCSKYLASLKDVKITTCANTAEAAKMLAESDRTDVASISSHNCASLYGLETVAEHIQNRENNYTRFICITKDLAIYPGANKMSLMFTLPHTPGSLYRMIAKFAAMGLNITKLESRPMPGRDFEFMFYLDVEASAWSDDVLNLISELTVGSEYFSFLGNYAEV